MSRKPERAVHAKMRLKRKAIDYIWQTTLPLGHEQLMNGRSSKAASPVNSKFLCSMYHQPIKLPFSKLCKSVGSRLWLATTPICRFEPMLLFETLFRHSIFKALYKNFLSNLIMTISETNIFEIEDFMCILKTNLSN